MRARGMDNEEEGASWSKVTAEDWKEMASDNEGQPQRTLLLVHGTGLRTRPGFIGLTKEEYQRLDAAYGGRILAFEHRALMHHLDRNSRELAAGLETGGIPLDLDVIGLSRGGLVVRMLVEGWQSLRADIRVRKLVFVGTPNDGTPSARRDRLGAGAREIKAWRQHVRGLAMVDQRDRAVEVYTDPFQIGGFDASTKECLGWPLLFGTQDQLPQSAFLQRLNGFSGVAPHPVHDTIYYGVASVFNFDHGAPNEPVLTHDTRRSICEWALPDTPNDLVVPTAGVFQPDQGPDACGRFPLESDRLMVLQPSCNATHTGIFRLRAVRQRIMDWLEV